MQQSFDNLYALVDEAICNTQWVREPENLYQPIEYVLSLGGKRIRPVLALMACNLFSDKVEEAVLPAIGMEVFHNFTLLHDDIMDNADTRRGKATVHKRWNANTAILSGDAMFIMAGQLLLKAPQHCLDKVLQVYHQTALEVCEGQQYDMDFETRDDVQIADYMEMIRLKTSVLLAGSLKIGALIGGADEADAQALYNYGIDLGLAFQLRDDYLDAFGDPKVFGKKNGGDILCNKKTFLLLEAMRLAGPDDRAVLLNYLQCNDPQRANEKIEAVTALYKKLGVNNRCEEQMKYYFDKSVAQLEKIQGAKYQVDIFKDLANKMLNREK